MKNYEIRELDESEQFDPSSLVPDLGGDLRQRTRDKVSFTQASFYGDWQKKLGRTVRRFIMSRGGETAAYFQMIKYPLLLNKSYLYIPYGPVTKDQSEDFLIEIRNELKKIAVAENAVFVRLDFSPVIPEDILSHLFTRASRHSYHSAYFQPRAEWFLDLDKAEEDILSSMHEKTRYSIRVSDKKEIVSEIITADFNRYFDVFHKLMVGTAERNGFSLHPKSYYENIFQSLQSANSYLSISRYGQKVLAIDMVIVFGGVANYVFGASSNDERNRMPSYAALWKAIRYAKQIGCDSYNFGGISTGNNVYEGWKGLTSFKKKFGGREVIHSDFFDVVVAPFWYHLYNLRKRLKKLI